MKKSMHYLALAGASLFLLHCSGQETSSPAGENDSASSPGGASDGEITPGGATLTPRSGTGFAVCDSGFMIPGAECAACLSTSCCLEAKACQADAGCLQCLTSPDVACNSNVPYQQYLYCSNLCSSCR